MITARLHKAELLDPSPKDAGHVISAAHDEGCKILRLPVGNKYIGFPFDFTQPVGGEYQFFAIV